MLLPAQPKKAVDRKIKRILQAPYEGNGLRAIFEGSRRPQHRLVNRLLDRDQKIRLVLIFKGNEMTSIMVK